MSKNIKIKSVDILNKYDNLVNYKGQYLTIKSKYIFLNINEDWVKVLPLKEIKEFKINK